VTIPRLTATANNYWLPAESTQINSGNSSNQKFSQIGFTPHNVGGYTEISRQLLVQSPKAADVVLNINLPRGLAVSIDYAGINGNGSGGQPVGILSYQTQTAIPNPSPTGTTANTLSSNGASIAFADMVTFQENAGIANSDGASFGYVTNPATAALLKKRQQFTGASFTLWEQDIFFSTNVCGATGLATEQVASGTLIGGPWGDVMVAIWDDLEISIDPYSNFQAGIIGTRAFASVDIGFRAPAAWTFVSGVT
jgi:HK97 family phage major capsid protein